MNHVFFFCCSQNSKDTQGILENKYAILEAEQKLLREAEQVLRQNLHNSKEFPSDIDIFESPQSKSTPNKFIFPLAEPSEFQRKMSTSLENSTLSYDTSSLRNNSTSLRSDTNSLPRSSNSLPRNTNSIPRNSNSLPRSPSKSNQNHWQNNDSNSHSLHNNSNSFSNGSKLQNGVREYRKSSGELNEDEKKRVEHLRKEKRDILSVISKLKRQMSDIEIQEEELHREVG